MNILNLIREIKENEKGIFSVCTGNFDVLRIVLEYMKDKDITFIIESTSNQVNQEGGYTGFKPVDFARKLKKLADEVGFDFGRIILGGDHLGPLPWRKLSSEEAMERGRKMVMSYVKAGYRKIHLDTSFPLGDEKDIPPEVAASRQADLCKVAEKTWKEEGLKPPVYVLGTEVPPAGGVVNKEEYVTTAEEFERVVSITEEIFKKRGLEDAWNRVIAFVVQPGVEFYKDGIRLYNPSKVKDLSDTGGKYHFVFEAHSTDFQPLENLSQMVKDGFSILKVGPELTFKFREGLFALERIEKELGLNPSGFSDALLLSMKENPKYWQSYYKDGSEIDMKYSLLDRVRYYLPDDRMKKAKEKLFENFKNKKLNFGIISQYFPDLFWDVLSGKVKAYGPDLVKAKVCKSIQRYIYATS